MIRSLYRSPDGTLADDLTPGQLKAALAEPRGLLWLDITTDAANLEQAAGLLKDLFAFHPLALNDALRQSHVPRVDDWADYLFVVLHAVSLTASHAVATHELDLFLGKNYLVSVHDEPVAVLGHLWDQYRQAPERYLTAGPARLLYALADAVVAEYLPVVDGLDEGLDQLEDEIFTRPHPRLIRRIFRGRRSLLRLRRSLAWQREVMNRLARDRYAVVAAEEQVYFRDVYDHLVRLYDVVEGLRDMAAGALDSYLGVTSNRTNEVMRTLTVVTVLFLPVSFVTSFFGMNFFSEGFSVPDPFTPLGLFWTSVAVMGATTLAMLVWMARRAMLRSGEAGEPRVGKGPKER